ncbi:MAG TPA: zinc-dependent alcohol dehydrogenase family protein [Chthoniobacteraceae bacterium]|jgi:trans-2-enoyl-CoA reductase|nr:zinc-dependent alcohol dehydrogenase family protein [Chthoniobacteraceae bacterium]
MKKSKSIIFHEFGPPEKVLGIVEEEVPEPRAGEVLIRVEAAPINPADLNVIEGKYPKRPQLPATPGMEGAAVIEKIGPEVSRCTVGARVLVPHGTGAWRQYATVPVTGISVIPPQVPPLQAAMLRINPTTAWRMLHDFVDLKPGDWVLQNAANSGVGRAVIVMAKSMGVHTVNIVRRPELVPELQALGADAVFVDSPDLVEQIGALISFGRARLALNAVGGESALRLANSLTREGVVVTYGAMGRQPMRIPNGLLIFKNLVWTGFWITAWYKHASEEETSAMFDAIFPLLSSGALSVPIAASYPLDQYAEAIRHASSQGRAGKILFVNPH